MVTHNETIILNDVTQKVYMKHWPSQNKMLMDYRHLRALKMISEWRQTQLRKLYMQD